MSDEAIEPDVVVVPAPDATPERDGAPAEDANPAAMAILEAIRAGASDPQKLMMSALADQGGDKPEVGMLLKMLTGDGGDNSNALRDQIREEIREEQSEVFAEISSVAERLLEENQLARERLDSLAAGIGACPVCFGENLLCETCHSVGRPGSRLPQPEEFNRFVCPALARVRDEIHRISPRRPWPRTSPAKFDDLDAPFKTGGRP